MRTTKGAESTLVENPEDMFSRDEAHFTQVIYEPPHDKTNKVACAPSKESAWASAQSDQILRCALNG